MSPSVIKTILRGRRWRLIGHVLRKPTNNISRVALQWTTEGKRKPGQNPVGLRTPWRRTVFKETKKTNYMGRIWEGGWRQWQVEEYSLCPMCHVHCKDKVACDPVGNCISWQGCCIDQRTYEKMIVMFY